MLKKALSDSPQKLDSDLKEAGLPVGARSQLIEAMQLAEKSTTKDQSNRVEARQDAYASDDAKTFIRRMDTSLTIFIDQLNEAELSFDLLKTLSPTQLEADLKECGVPSEARKRIADALEEATTNDAPLKKDDADTRRPLSQRTYRRLFASRAGDAVEGDNVFIFPDVFEERRGNVHGGFGILKFDDQSSDPFGIATIELPHGDNVLFQQNWYLEKDIRKATEEEIERAKLTAMQRLTSDAWIDENEVVIIKDLKNTGDVVSSQPTASSEDKNDETEGEDEAEVQVLESRTPERLVIRPLSSRHFVRWYHGEVRTATKDEMREIRHQQALYMPPGNDRSRAGATKYGQRMPLTDYRGDLKIRVATATATPTGLSLDLQNNCC